MVVELEGVHPNALNFPLPGSAPASLGPSWAMKITRIDPANTFDNFSNRFPSTLGQATSQILVEFCQYRPLELLIEVYASVP